MPDIPPARSLVEMVAQFKSDVQAMQLVVDTLASIGDSCEAPMAIQAREALVRIGNFVPAVLDAIAEPSDTMIAAGVIAHMNNFEAPDNTVYSEIWSTMIAALRKEIEDGFEDVTHPSQIGARDQRPFPPHGCHGKLEFCRNLGHCSRGEHGQCDAGELCPSELW